MEMEQIPSMKIQLFCASGRFHLTLIPTSLVGILTWFGHPLCRGHLQRSELGEAQCSLVEEMLICWNRAPCVRTVSSGSSVNSQQDGEMPELLSCLWLFENTITIHHGNMNLFWTTKEAKHSSGQHMNRTCSPSFSVLSFDLDEHFLPTLCLTGYYIFFPPEKFPLRFFLFQFDPKFKECSKVPQLAPIALY